MFLLFLMRPTWEMASPPCTAYGSSRLGCGAGGREAGDRADQSSPHARLLSEHRGAGAAVVEAVGRDRLDLQFDVHHCQTTEGDITKRMEEFLPVIAHMQQIADVPACNEPAGEIAGDSCSGGWMNSATAAGWGASIDRRPSRNSVYGRWSNRWVIPNAKPRAPKQPPPPGQRQVPWRVPVSWRSMERTDEAASHGRNRTSHGRPAEHGDAQEIGCAGRERRRPVRWHKGWEAECRASDRAKGEERLAAVVVRLEAGAESPRLGRSAQRGLVTRQTRQRSSNSYGACPPKFFGQSLGFLRPPRDP
jgi:hypothetical protein